VNVYRGGEAKGENAVGFAKNASGDVGEGCCNRGTVWVRGWGEATSEEASLYTREGGRPLLKGGAAALVGS